jgi:hypothetical protein
MWSLVIVAIILVLFYYNKKENLKHYKPCRNCTGNLPKGGMTIMNPFTWPMSGANCVDDLYRMPTLQQVTLQPMNMACNGSSCNLSVGSSNEVACLDARLGDLPYQTKEGLMVEGSVEDALIRQFNSCPTSNAPLTHLSVPDHVPRV